MVVRKWIGVGLFVAAASLSGESAWARSNGAKASKPVAPASGQAELARATETFTPFCEEWMGKLAARETANLARLEWKASGSGYQGTYVGYPKEHGCTVSNDGKVPVGRVLYREVTYQQEGSTLEEAKASAPRPVEIYEVTELFRFNKGRWTTD